MSSIESAQAPRCERQARMVRNFASDGRFHAWGGRFWLIQYNMCDSGIWIINARHNTSFDVFQDPASFKTPTTATRLEFRGAQTFSNSQKGTGD